MHTEALRSAGVVLALPEHILSFNLSGLQRLADNRMADAAPMIRVQGWLRKYCRDVLDECDSILAVRTQLIYPSGTQKAIDGHPHRWQIVETLLQLVNDQLWNLRQEYPHSLEVINRAPDSFPLMCFLTKDVEDALLTRLTDRICTGRTSIIPATGYTFSDWKVIRQYVSEARVSPVVVEKVHQIFRDNAIAQQNLNLVRGLLVHRILLLALKKRWNVQYGLHPFRDPIAVPYSARGVPSEQSEWGHPDVAILLTCLAFYYQGLSNSQLRLSLECIGKADDPFGEYDRWIQSVINIPGSFREWTAINLDDEIQIESLWRQVRFNTSVINYFLNESVFPKHAKQFEVKLQTSGWDIPQSASHPSSAMNSNRSSIAKRSAMTTGFSGTNDSRILLPLNIKQQDLPGLLHTNAMVLTSLLQPRNRHFEVAVDRYGKRLSEVGLLQRLEELGIRVLIDAGAQILEMDNHSLVTAWLRICFKAPAAVYFNAENKPFVRYRQGHQVPLLASPFAENLADCLVYLDEAHTRGTDLKIPVGACGALTLGLGQTKDHTVQGKRASGAHHNLLKLTNPF